MSTKPLEEMDRVYEADNHRVLFEEFAEPHRCERVQCTDAYSMSRIVFDRIVATMPVSNTFPPFDASERITVVGAVTRNAHDLSNPDATLRSLVAYHGTWSVERGLMWLKDHFGYLSLSSEGTAEGLVDSVP